MLKYCILLYVCITVSSQKLNKSEIEEIESKCGKLIQRRFKSFKIVHGNQPEAWLTFVTSIICEEAICTGALISSRHVLTARHCFKGNGAVPPCRDNFDLYEYRVGASVSGQGKPLKSKKIFLPKNLKHDIAIVELEADVNDKTPLCLSHADTKINDQHDALLVAGWDFQELDSSRTRNAGQLYVHQTLVTNLSECVQNKNPRFFCTKEQKSIVCHGDSGGSIFQKRVDGRYESVGTTSQANPGFCKHEDYFDRKVRHKGTPIYTDVRKYMDFICESIGLGCSGKK